MFSLFKNISGKTPPPPPELEVCDFQQGQLEVRSAKALTPGSLQVILKLPQGKPAVTAKINIESGLDDQLIYWAKIEEPADLSETLVEIFPPQAVAELEETFEEKRQEERLNKVLGILSREIPGFKTVSFDVSTRGVRIVSEKELPVGRPLRFKLDLDDARLDPLDVEGEILWCKARDPKAFWLGVRFTKISEANQALIEKFLNESRSVEHGVISRDYAND